MRFLSTHRGAVLLLASLLLLAGCDILSGGPPRQVHVIVDATPQEPLLLIVSSNFQVGTDGQGNSSSNIARGDSTFVSAPYDHTYTLATSAGQILVRLENNSQNTESARLRIFLDGKSDFDSSKDLGSGEFMEYAYQNLSY